MNRQRWYAGVLAALFLLAVLGGTRAEDVKATDEGPAEKFKGKKFKLKAKEKAAIILEFPEGKEATLTVRCGKKEKSDVNLFIHDAEKKEVAKDDSPGPSCDLKYTSKKGGKYTIEIVNLGPDAVTASLKVSFGKKKKGKADK
jgi:hypothetical protein